MQCITVPIVNAKVEIFTHDNCSLTNFQVRSLLFRLDVQPLLLLLWTMRIRLPIIECQLWKLIVAPGSKIQLSFFAKRNAYNLSKICMSPFSDGESGSGLM